MENKKIKTMRVSGITKEFALADLDRPSFSNRTILKLKRIRKLKVSKGLRGEPMYEYKVYYTQN